MSSLLDQYYEQIQGINRQRQMTGNEKYKQGALGELTQGYLEAQFNKQDANKRLALQEQQQAWAQNMQQQQLDNAKSQQTLGLIGSAAGGAAQLYQMNKYLNKIPDSGQAVGQALGSVPSSMSWGNGTGQALQYGSPAYLALESGQALYDSAPLVYGSPEYLAEAAKWGVEPVGEAGGLLSGLGDTLGGVFDWLTSWF
jgi:hypothetical protein